MAGFFESQPSDQDKGKPVTDDLQWEIKFFEGVVSDSPDYVEALIVLGDLYTRSGYVDQGLEVDRRLARLLPEDALVHYNLACSLSLLENIDESIEELANAIKLGYCDYRHIIEDDDLSNVRHDPRFRELVRILRSK